MKKILLLICFLLAGLASLSAQQIVRGTVTDKDGNPIPGARVEIVGSPEAVITELDGTFRLETRHPANKVKVYYAGMQTKVQTVGPDMVVKLSKTNWWNKKPHRYGWLVGVQGAFPENGASHPSFGLMLGRVKELGWYVKGVAGPGKATDCDYASYHENGNLVNYWTTGKDKRSFYAVTAGIVARLKCPLHLYAGVGYANRKVAWELADGTYAKHTGYSYSGVAIDYGLMLKMGKFTVNGGTIMSLADGCEFVGNVGVGICF